MAKLVTWADLFDFSNPSDIKKAIALMGQLDKEYVKFINTADAGTKKLTSNQKKLVDSVKTLSVAMSKLKEQNANDQQLITQSNSQLKVLNSTYKNQSAEIAKLQKQIASLTKERKAVKASVQDVNNINKEAIKLEAQLGKLTGQNAKETAALKLRIQEKRKALSDEAKVAAGRVTLYQKEVKRLNELTNKYLSVALAQGKTSKAARVLEKEMTVLRAKIQGVEQVAGRGHRTVGLYGKSMLGAAKNIASAFGLVGGAVLFADLVRGTFELIKETERYNKALKQVTDSTEEYEEQLIFLEDISSRYGINLNKLTDSYTKFFAATKGTNLEGKETQRIFDAVSKSAAVMSLTTEDTEGALKALGQMISKGKIQAEELRGQLGDRLPGAFRIMADALNVTTSELDKMLKDGKLLAEDVLPKFATQLEVAFGLDKVDSIDTLSAAQVRLTNSWITFVKSVEDGEGVIAQFTISAINGITSILNALSKADDELADGFLSHFGITTLEQFNAHMEKINLSLSENEQKVADLARQYLINREGLRLYNAAIEDGFETLESFKSVQKEFINQYAEEKDNLDILNAVYLEYTSRIEEAKEETVESSGEMSESVERMESTISTAFGRMIHNVGQLGVTFKAIFGRDFWDLSVVKAGADELLEEVNAGIAQRLEAEKQAKAERERLAREETANKIGIAQQFASAVSMIGNQLFTNEQINRDNDLKNFVDAKNVELEAVGENAEARAAITEEIKRKEKEAQIATAKAAKNQALFNIAISTAQAILTVTAQTGVAAPFVIPGIIALGALQAGLVASQPLPSFAEGTMSAPAGDKITSEEGSEMVITPQGKVFLTGNKGAEVRKDIPEGSAILTNAITENILKGGFDHKQLNTEASLQITQVLQQQQDRNTRLMVKTLQDENTFLAESFRNSIKELPEIHQWKIKKGELQESMRKGNTTYDNWKRKNSHAG